MKKNINEPYYLVFTDVVSVEYNPRVIDDSYMFPCTIEEAQQIVKLRGEQYMIYKQAKERYETDKKQSRKTRAKT